MSKVISAKKRNRLFQNKQKLLLGTFTIKILKVFYGMVFYHDIICYQK